MKRTDELLASFDTSWDQFSESWKKARAKASEKSIHGLRVGTRRLIATLELTRGLSKRAEISKLQRRFKKVLKGMGPLRDVQVQLDSVAHMRQKKGLILDFKQALERRERRQIDNIGKELKRGTKRRLVEDVKDVRSEFVRLHEKLGEDKVHRSIERVVKARHNEFLRARKRFQPSNVETLHEMRIALKKLRYTVEAAEPVLHSSAKESARKMQAFQQLLGDTRDIELLQARLEKWGAKKGKKTALVPALESLQEKRELLMQKIIESAKSFQEIIPPADSKPEAEVTEAVATPSQPDYDGRPAVQPRR